MKRDLQAKVAAAGAGQVALAGLMLTGPENAPGHDMWAPLGLTGAACLAAPGVLTKANPSARKAARAGTSKTRRKPGLASGWDIQRTTGRSAMRRKAGVVRPSLAGTSRTKLRTKDVATPVVRVGLQRIYSPVEDVTLRIGGPRSGKSGEMACRILDAPGAVISTSTRTDLYELTRRQRARKGPAWVFNPTGMAGLDSTMRFDPLRGCEQPATAAARATDLLGSSSGDDSERGYWVGQAHRALKALMHAAAVGGHTMRDVLDWTADPDTHTATILRLLHRSPEPSFASDAQQFLSTNERTRSSICTTMMPALSWVTDATAYAATQPDPAQDGADTFDVERLLTKRGTVYLLGQEEAQVAPLVAALTGMIAREARRLAANQPGGRLDPPLTLALDEAAIICPIPLDSWSADMGGRNVQIHISLQSLAQLKQRWGEYGAASILNNAATLLIFGGLKNADELQALSTLIGETDEKVSTYGDDGKLASTTVRKVPIFAPSEISQLPPMHVIVLRRGTPPAYGTVRMAWKRLDVRTENIRERGEAARARVAAAFDRRRQRRADTAAIEALFDTDPAQERPALRVVRDGDQDEEGAA